MAVLGYTSFRGVTNVNDDDICQNLLYGLIDFLRWASLGIGSYQNITRRSPASSGVYGGSRSRLRLVQDPNYTDGQVWEGFRHDWVWESGVGFRGDPPIKASGVYVNGSFKYKSDATNSHYIDYKRGRVIFDTAIDTLTTVETNFSHRTVNFIPADTYWFRELMFNSYRVDKNEFLTAGSGNWSQLARTRQQMPVVGIEIVPGRKYRGYQLGGGHMVEQDVLFYIMATNREDRNNWVDRISNQNNMTIWTINRKTAKESATWPFDYDYKGEIISSPTQYPALVAPTGDGGFRWKTATFSNCRLQDMQNINDWLFTGVVRTTFEIPMLHL